MASGSAKPKKEPVERFEDDQSQDRKFEAFDDSVPPCDYYCPVCQVKMNSDRAWSMHATGRRHQKKMTSASLGVTRRTHLAQDPDVQQIKIAGGPYNIRTKPTNEVAQLQRTIDNDHNHYYVGLDFVQEIWRKDGFLEPIYICTLCKADCQHITILSHCVGFRHRMSYIKIKDPVKYNRFNNSSEKKSILSELVADFTRRLEKEFGRGTVKVHTEIDLKDEKVSDDDLTERPMEIEPPIQSASNEEICESFQQSTRPARKKIVAELITPDVGDTRPMTASEIKKLREMKFECYKRHILKMSEDEQMELGRAFDAEDYSFIAKFNAKHFGLKPLS